MTDAPVPQPYYGTVLPPGPPAPPSDDQPDGTGPAWWGERERPRFELVLGAVAGVLAAFGVFALLSEADSDTGRATAALLCVVGVVTALVARTRTRGPLAVLCVAVVALLALGPVGFMLAADGGPGPLGSATLFFLVPTAVWATSYAIGPAQGRPVLLGLAAVGLLFLLLVQAVPGLGGPLDPSDSFSSEASFQGGEDDTSGVEDTLTAPFSAFFGFSPDTTPMGGIALLLGLVYVGLAVGLDRQGRPGAATPLVAAGDLALVLSLLFLASDLKAGGTGVYALVLGAALCRLGAESGRRATVWLGALGMLIGVGGLIDAGVDDESATVAGAMALVAGAIMATVAVALDRGLLGGGVRPSADRPPPSPGP